jgi:methionyl-tRNA synthetase
MARYALHEALASVMAVVSEANRYFAAQQPWALKKTDPERMNTVLYVTIEVLRQVGILLSPFIPHASAKLLTALGQDANVSDKAQLMQALKPHAPLPAPQPLFPRYVEPETPNHAG